MDSPSQTPSSRPAPTANSDPTTRSAYLSALRQIDRIPVPDLASTLSTAATSSDDDLAASHFALGNVNADASVQRRLSELRARYDYSRAPQSASLLPTPLQLAEDADDDLFRALSAGPPNSSSASPPPPPAPLPTTLAAADSTQALQRQAFETPSLLEQHHRRLVSLTNSWRTTMEERDARLDRLERVLAQLNRVHGGDALLDSATARASGDGERSANGTATGTGTGNGNGNYATSWTSAVDPQMERRLAHRQAELDRIRRESHERDVELQRIQWETRDVMRLFANRDDATSAASASASAIARTEAQQAQLQMHAQLLHRNQQQALLMQQQQARLQSIQERSLRTSALRASASASQQIDRTPRQDGRRHPRFWARHRELLNRSGDSADMHSAADGSTPGNSYGDRPQSRNQNSSPELQSTSTFRSRYRQAGQESAEVSSASLMLQETMVYLSNLRQSASRDDAVAFALQAAFSYRDFANSNFISDLDQLPPPMPTSLMAPGAMFKGSQFSSSAMPTSSLPQADSFAAAMFSETPIGMPAHYPPSQTTDADGAWRRAHSSLNTNQAPTRSTDSWPVKVSIYDIDFGNMTLSASMEAYDVPSSQSSATSPTATAHSSGTIHHPITTYLEGEILDFKKNTFITENFPSTTSRDLTYWKKLPPFNEHTTSDLAARLLERDFMAKVNAEYVLMRWKERCFVSHAPGGPLPRRAANGGAVWRPDNNNNGGGGADANADADVDASLDSCHLTISGFYYVSLKRSDGAIEGLYCDPQSNPYQFLKLSRVKTSAFPSWTFK